MTIGPLGARRLTVATRVGPIGPDPAYRAYEPEGAGLEARLARVARKAWATPWRRSRRPSSFVQATRAASAADVGVVPVAIANTGRRRPRQVAEDGAVGGAETTQDEAFGVAVAGPTCRPTLEVGDCSRIFKGNGKCRSP